MNLSTFGVLALTSWAFAGMVGVGFVPTSSASFDAWGLPSSAWGQLARQHLLESAGTAWHRGVPARRSIEHPHRPVAAWLDNLLNATLPHAHVSDPSNSALTPDRARQTIAHLELAWHLDPSHAAAPTAAAHIIDRTLRDSTAASALLDRAALRVAPGEQRAAVLLAQLHLAQRHRDPSAALRQSSLADELSRCPPPTEWEDPLLATIAFRAALTTNPPPPP